MLRKDKKKQEIFDDEYRRDTEYKPDTAYDRAIEAYKSYQDAQKKKETAYNDLVNRQEFRYNVNKDLMYDRLVQDYADTARMASEDAMGRAAALTGGYGSSYAQQVGQQTYQDYMGNLSAEADKLYDRALDRYMMQGDLLSDKYALASDKANEKYANYVSEMEAANQSNAPYAPKADMTKFIEKMNTFDSLEEAAEYFDSLVENGYILEEDVDWLFHMYADKLPHDPFYGK